MNNQFQPSPLTDEQLVTDPMEYVRLYNKKGKVGIQAIDRLIESGMPFTNSMEAGAVLMTLQMEAMGLTLDQYSYLNGFVRNTNRHHPDKMQQMFLMPNGLNQFLVNFLANYQLHFDGETLNHAGVIVPPKIFK